MAKVEDRPGVTRGKQWAKLESGAELLDMPGVLWPKFDDQEVAEHLAFTGAIKDDVMDIEMLAMRLLEVLCKDYLPLVTERYKITAEEAQDLDGYDLLELVARKRGMLMSGGSVNTCLLYTSIWGMNRTPRTRGFPPLLGGLGKGKC